MKQNTKLQIVIFLFLFVLIASSFSQASTSHTRFSLDKKAENRISRQILFPPLYGTITYLIDNTGVVNHTWSSSYTPGAAVYWLGDGTILRTIRTVVGGGGSGGGLQKMQWDGTIVWDFRYDSNGKISHHDIEPLPNGNVLMIAWETKTRTEAIASGRNPSTVTYQGLMVDHIIEVQPTGPTSGQIVWEWHAWDHLIQDYDPSKENYGIVGDHPELVDINFGTFFMSNNDWLHSNSIDYHPEFDQILLSVHNFNEIWVIDHSTTTEEAAGHTGGNSGKGGDLLYRWGNPRAYDAGSASDQKLFSQHGSSWIKPGYPGGGNILVFNNGNDRPSGQYSTVDEFTPPVDSTGQYELQPGLAYGPEEYTWTYSATPPTSFYSYYCGDAVRLEDGNTLICDGVAGKIFEVTPENDILWQYVNPYPAPSLNDVFKIDYIAPAEPPEPGTPDLTSSGALSWNNVKPAETVSGSFKIQNIGDAESLLNWTVNTSSISWGTWSFTPASGEGLTPEAGAFTVQVTVVAPSEENREFEGYVRVENADNSSDVEFIPVYLKTPKNTGLLGGPMYHFMVRLKSVYFKLIHSLYGTLAWF